ncbi:MAG: ribonuclease P [Candidatus Marsarchaeota archaeon]|nr:ribonuclease P [Candidatus Marsarchaeota archaeon]
MKNSELSRKIAIGRIGRLAKLAEDRTLEGDTASRRLAKRYVDLARRISQHYKVSIPKELKQRVCRNCGNFLVPGVNCTVRLVSSRGYAAYVCECGEERHIFYKKAH